MNKQLLLLLILLPLLQACDRSSGKTNWNITLTHEGKKPYDTWLAYESLPQYFPQAQITALSRSFRYTSIDNRMIAHPDDSAALLVMTGLSYYVSDDEWANIKRFAKEGNEVFILCSSLDNKIESELKCSRNATNETSPPSVFNDGRLNQQVLSLLPDTSRRYGFNGRSLQGNFALQPVHTAELSGNTTLQDTLLQSAAAETGGEEDPTDVIDAPQILGFHRSGNPNFLRYPIGAGHITIHAAPLALSNYFLLQEGNRAYLDGIWHAFPDHINRVYWNDYYIRSTEGSSLGVLWRYPATRWALIIAIATLVIYVLMGLRRRQRIIPIVKPLENASVSFVETVGQLYFNKGNHANLAEKMIQHFLEWVRTYYFLDTSRLNDTFAQQLAAKSGKSEETVQSLLRTIHDIRLGTVVITQEYLFQLYHTLQSFYNNQSS